MHINTITGRNPGISYGEKTKLSYGDLLVYMYQNKLNEIERSDESDQ